MPRLQVHGLGGSGWSFLPQTCTAAGAGNSLKSPIGAVDHPGYMAAVFVETSARVRLALTVGAALLAVLVAAILADAVAGLGPLGPSLHRWAAPAASVLAAASALLRVATVERERRAWLPLTTGLTSYALAWLLFASVWGAGGDAPLPSPADALWVAFYPAAYATIAMLLRSSFVRAPASMWLDGLLAALAFAAIGVAVIYAPLVHRAAGPALGVASQVFYPLADLLLVALVLGVIAMSGWRPGRRWTLLGAAMLCWFVGDTINLSQAASGTTVAPAIALSVWCAGLGLLAIVPWQRPESPEGLRVEGLRMLLAPSIFSLVALATLAAGQVHPSNVVTQLLALGAVAVALARTTLTLREVQLLADARHESLTDELTGLPSRRHFHRRLDTALRQAEVDEVPVALLIFDLDRFKELNDTLGHGAGDTLLQLVARRVHESLGRGALLARLGGDEFAVLLPPGQGREAGLRAADRVMEAVERPFEVEGLELDIGASVGVALYPEHAHDDGELLRRADVAMYLAKGAGGGVAVYDPDRDLHTRDRLALGQQLRAGIERGELRLFYQPKVDPQLGRVLGVEALVRWQHPAHGMLMPPDFLPLAGRSGLMPRLTRKVLAAALAQLARWRADGLDLTLAVNLATSDLLDPALAEDVARLLAEHDVPPTLLCLEVTEDGLIAEPERAAATLEALSELGVRIALDDFGTGWSSLVHLRRLRVDELKIDRSFVIGMAADEDDASIVRTTLDLGRSLRLRVVAEGVEDEETWTLLADLGCDAIQGFVLSRPLPAGQIDAWLSARREGAVARCTPPGQQATFAPTPGRYRL
jgi:diguanylate cyclase